MRRLARLLAFAVVLNFGTVPAAAAGEGGQIAACLDAAADRTVAAACIGRLNAACQQSAEGQTTVGMADCLMAETRAWDAVLNRLWPEVMAAARYQDATRADGTSASADGLIAAQRAWIAFRDAECGWAWQRWSEGTIRSLVGGECRMQMTAERVLDFRDWLGGD